MYKVIFSKKAVKDLSKIVINDQKQIHKHILKLSQDPFFVDIKKLEPTSAGTHRSRTGSYRLFLNIDTESKEIIVAKIERRTTVTYR